MRWHRIQSKLWYDERVQRLTYQCRYLFLYLLTAPAANSIGLYVCRAETIAADTGLDLDTILALCGDLESTGLARFDHTLSLVWVRNKVRHDPPANPSVAQGMMSELFDLPRSTLVLDFLKQYQSLESVSTGQLRAFAALCSDRADTMSTQSTDGAPSLTIPLTIPKEEIVKPKRRSPTPDPTTQLGMDCATIIEYLNGVTGRLYEIPSKELIAVLSGGAPIDDVKLVIDWTWWRWGDHNDLRSNVNPTTPFRPSHWGEYLQCARQWDAEGRPARGKTARRIDGAQKYDNLTKEAQNEDKN